MALQDALSELAGKSPATKNRVDLLLDSLGGAQDYQVLMDALNNPYIRAAALTQALKQEYGPGAVTDTSVSAWRRKNLAEVNGL